MIPFDRNYYHVMIIMFQFTSANYKKYHIIAVEPQNDEAFAFVCNSVDVDILTFNAESKLFKLTRKSAEKLAKKGYHFEIQYSSAIHSRIKRRNIISTAHLFHMYAKSRQILISSGATHPIHLRGPYDVMNLYVQHLKKIIGVFNIGFFY